MARVERGNVVLHIEDDLVDYYVGLGYNHTDEEGNILKATLPNDIPTLQRFYVDHLAKIEALEAEVARLSAKGSSDAKKATPKKSSTKVEDEKSDEKKSDK